jgi:DNA invertase Pin-like site-specific DNA recombinase
MRLFSLSKNHYRELILQKNNRHRLKVAAYCRVSTKYEEQSTSLESQIRYYEEKIQSNPDWEFAGTYAESVSGVNFKKRDEWNRMMADCRKGKIDLIITKSISRFGRNTLPFLRSVNELAEKGITVYFENENIQSSDPEARHIIAILAALAQEESQSKSENIKWGIRRRMEKGKPMLNHIRFLGYTKDDRGELVVVPEEAEIVRLIFELYLQGNGVRKIKRYLEENQIRTVTGKQEWSTSTIDRMLSNEKYVGDALLQKTVTEDFLTGKRSKNAGQQTQYYVENNHDPIIERAVFEKVQRKKSSKSVQQKTNNA